MAGGSGGGTEWVIFQPNKQTDSPEHDLYRTINRFFTGKVSALVSPNAHHLSFIFQSLLSQDPDDRGYELDRLTKSQRRIW
jgi:hypothetical protein